jgi:hypothetical protein
MVRHFFFSRGGYFFLSAKTHAILNSKVRWFSFIFPLIKDIYNYSGINNDRCSKQEAPTEQPIAKVDLEKGERSVLSFVFSSRKLYTQIFIYIDK